MLSAVGLKTFNSNYEHVNTAFIYYLCHWWQRILPWSLFVHLSVC